MRYSKIALLSTLSAFALLTASTASRAFAPPSSVTDIGMLKPHGVWQVGSVNAKTVNYCAMVSQFDKEVSLAFARNSSGFGSLAIDFPGDVLENGSIYTISLQVDDLDARQYNVRANSPRSVIVQIGQDESFYSALGGNGTLRVTMPTMDMKFDLKKFSSSYIALVSCADKLQQHDQGPKTAAMPVTPVEKLPLTAAQTGSGAKTAVAATAVAPVSLAAAIPSTTPPPLPSSAAQAASHDDLQLQMEAVRKALHDKGINMVDDTPPGSQVAPQKTATNTPVSSLTPAEKTSTVVPAPSKPVIQWTTAEKKELDNSSHLPKGPAPKLTIAEENIELKNKLAQAEVDRTALKNNIDLLKAEKDALQSKMTMQDKQSKLLEAALNGKENDLSSVRSLSIEDSKTLTDVQTELTNLKRDHAVAIADLQTKLAEKTAQYDTLQRQFADAGEVSRSTQQQSTQAQAELDLTRQRLSQAVAQLASAEQQKNELTSQVESEGQQRKVLLEQMKEQLDKSRAQVSMLENQMISVTMQRDDLASQLDVQVKENNSLQAAVQVKEQGSPSLAAIAPAPSTGRINGNLSSSEEGYLPAITPQQTVGQGDPSLVPPPLLKASVTGVRGPVGSRDENWETIVVQ